MILHTEYVKIKYKLAYKVQFRVYLVPPVCLFFFLLMHINILAYHSNTDLLISLAFTFVVLQRFY